MSKKTRTKACKLAVQCLGSKVAAGGSTAGRLMALVVFFETYITHGADETERRMKLLGGRKKRGLRVVAGGNLESAGGGQSND